MSRPSHLYIALSGHGLGHLAQIAPVVNRLRQRLPDLQLTVQTTLAETAIRARISGSLTMVNYQADFGMVMADALTVKVEDSITAYRDFHQDWDRRLAEQTALLTDHAPDLLLADIPYLTLAAAAEIGLPSVALCSLNWHDVLASYDSTVDDLLTPMAAAYRSAEIFLQPEPSMPMTDFGNLQPIGPIAAIGEDRRIELHRQLAIDDPQTVVLVSLGGFDIPISMQHWPQLDGIHWLVPPSWHTERNDIRSLEDVKGLSFIDLLRSVDVLLTKPGYGSFTEATCNATRVLYLDRTPWPEEPWLSRWLTRYGNGRCLSRDELNDGNVLTDSLAGLLSAPLGAPLEPTGSEQAAERLYCILTAISPASR